MMSYAAWLFDCDGVMLDSNSIKTDAFHRAALPHGEAAAAALVSYHTAHGGISRFEKFDYLFRHILGRTSYDDDMAQALDQFSRLTREALLSAPEAPGLRTLLERINTGGGRAFVVTGGMEDEVRSVLEERGLAALFTGIFGSPASKDEIFQTQLASGTMARPGVYFGDSRYDYDVASRHGMDFVFVSDWSEFAGWQTFFADRPVTIISRLGEFPPPDGVSST